MVLGPILAGVGFFALYSSSALQERATQDLRATLSMQQQFMEYFVRERVRDIGALAQDPRVLSLPPDRLKALFLSLLKDESPFGDIAFADATGRTVVDAKYAANVDISDREYFQQGKAGKSHVSDALKSRITGHSVIFVSSPVHDATGRFRGLVFGSVRLDTFVRFMQTMHAETASRAFFLKADGTLLSPPVPPAKPDAKPLRSLKAGDVIYDAAQARTMPHGIYRNHDGDRVVGSYKWILDGRWLLVAETPETEILALHAGILAVPLLGAALLFLIFSPVALRLARSLDGPLRRLEEHSRRIETGDFNVHCELDPDPEAPEEIRRLNSAYCLMVERVQTALDDLRQASLTDPLTGAPNRKHLLQEGPRLVEATARSGKPVSFLTLDLDHFKNVNDTYGHATGDAVLEAFSKALGRKVRGSDIFARMGGEEFAVLAPNAGDAEALELAERIRRSVEEMRIPVEGGEIGVTVSIGVATLPAGSQPEGALGALMACSDKAMYEAKNSGRNKVVRCADSI